jgi:FAD/FMN-containing dehydrogenase/Fe-S oxidoreductase
MRREMKGAGSSGDRTFIPGIGPAAEPAERLAHEEHLYGTQAKVSEEAARSLEDDLRRGLEGEVRFDAGSRALYATDGSNYRQVPIGVVIPRTEQDVVETLAACRRHGAPVLSRGGGTSLAGQCCNVAVVIDYSKYLNRVLWIDAERKRARVQPGVVLDVLREEAERHGLTFGPDPSTHNHCTLGGMIGNNSCGTHSMMAGRTAENVHRLDVLTYDGLRMEVGRTDEQELQRLIQAGGRKGEIYQRLSALAGTYADLIRARFPKIPRRVSGYNLDELLPEHGFDVARALVGSEGTCVAVLEAELRLVPSPPSRVLLVLGYPNVYTAADHVVEIAGFQPTGLEGIDEMLVEDMKKRKLHPERVRILPDGKGWLLVEFGGQDRREAEAKARACMEELKSRPGTPAMKLFEDPKEESIVWKVRESGLGATARVPGSPDTWEGWEDSAVPPDRLGAYLRRLHALYDKYGYQGALYGHFGQGCVHTRITFDLTTRRGTDTYRSFVEEAADLVVSLGGSLSGEHGDGQSRGELLPRMFGPELVEGFRTFKSIWDPSWKMNPGKVVDPYRLDENLRLGEGYHELRPATHFRFPEDQGSFGRATTRCVGVGECRRDKEGVMCPSYRVTREEMHSTRGRAHLLFEMMEGGPLTRGWKDEHVKESLDLCLACKGCKSDCPMNVDMATYKAEFLSHYYEGRLRPRHAYAMGLIDRWAALAALAPRLANFFAQTPGLASLAKLVAGIAPERRVPAFAPYTFRRWFRARARPALEGPRVLLFADTFNDHFHPQTAIAVTEALESAGYVVEIPERRLCCGRPLYDFGMLDRARRYLEELLDVLTPYVDAGIPIVGIEPSCVAVLRDELLGMFPGDPRAERLSKATVLLSELIEREGESFPLPRLERKALVQGHCHHHAVMGLDAELKVLRKMGLDVEHLQSGCCGMAGSFGFEAGQAYEVSVAAGERVLLPAVREAAEDTLIVANGFSCREQIAQGTDRRGLHLAEVMKLAREGGAERLPERRIVGRLPALPLRARIGRGLVQAALAGAVVGAVLWSRRGRRRI